MGPSRMQLTKPVIAAIEGYAVAGGLELALWADLRVAAADAVLGVFCRRWGVPLIDGGTVRLPRLIGQSRAMDLVLTGRPVAADEAYAMGLVNRLVRAGQALEVAAGLAAELAALPQTCMRHDRLSVLEQWGLVEGEAMGVELAHGLVSLESDALAGAARFAAGAGRHGAADRAHVTSRARPQNRRQTTAQGSPSVRREALKHVVVAGGTTQCGRSVARAALSRNDVAQEFLDFRLAVAAVATQRADGAQLAGLGPARDRLRVHAEHGGYLSGREEGFSFGRSRYHGAPLLMH